MVSELQPSEPRRSRLAMPAGITARTPSLRTAFIVFITVLILFRWLHLILALEITSTGQQIQTLREELSQHQRAIADLRLRIAAAQSPERLAPRAEEMGYRPAKRIYLPQVLDLPPPTAGESLGGTAASAQQTESEPRPGFLARWAATLGVWEETQSAP